MSSENVPNATHVLVRQSPSPSREIRQVSCAGRLIARDHCRQSRQTLWADCALRIGWCNSAIRLRVRLKSRAMNINELVGCRFAYGRSVEP